MKRAIAKLFKQYAQIMGVVLVAWVSIGPAGSIQAKRHKLENRPGIRVAVYNEAGTDSFELRDAEYQAAELFAEAGIKITWLNYSHKQRLVRCQHGNSSADFFLRIVSGLGTLSLATKADALGQSMVPAPGDGYVTCGTASVFYDRLIAFASVVTPQSPQILGDAMAHELGHLLLGTRHSRQGIMKARWTLRDLGLAKCGKLRFSPEQLAALQRVAQSLQSSRPGRFAARRRIRPDA